MKNNTNELNKKAMNKRELSMDECEQVNGGRSWGNRDRGCGGI